jgi:hypothetical protein
MAQFRLHSSSRSSTIAIEFLSVKSLIVSGGGVLAALSLAWLLKF